MFVSACQIGGEKAQAVMVAGGFFGVLPCRARGPTGIGDLISHPQKQEPMSDVSTQPAWVVMVPKNKLTSPASRQVFLRRQRRFRGSSRRRCPGEVLNAQNQSVQSPSRGTLGIPCISSASMAAIALGEATHCPAEERPLDLNSSCSATRPNGHHRSFS